MRCRLQESYVIRCNSVGSDRITLSDLSTWGDDIEGGSVEVEGIESEGIDGKDISSERKGD